MQIRYNVLMATIMDNVVPYDSIRPIEWQQGKLKLLDQRYLPDRSDYIYLDNIPDTAMAIRDMVVRGAPAIGITAAYGVVLGVQQHLAQHPGQWRQLLEPELQRLAQARPTAINLHWAIARMRSALSEVEGNDAVAAALQAAQQIHAEDIEANRTMGQFGASYLKSDSVVLTHCNAGALATGGFGTAVGVIRTAFAQGKLKQVFADETRPWLQGARLTAWELEQERIPVDVLVEGAAAYLMQQKMVDWVVVGSDRIAANGDVANKIGTYSLAVLARHHGVGFMVAAPTSTIDPDTASAAAIPIERRDAGEILKTAGINSSFIGAWNPVFDVTPADLIDVIVTEKGAIEKPNAKKVADLLLR